jgi:hypothetical protein
MITIKHLARRLDIDPYSLRMALRNAGLKPGINRRWKWEDVEDESYKEALKVGKLYVSKTFGRESSRSAGSTPEDDGADSREQD